MAAVMILANPGIQMAPAGTETRAAEDKWLAAVNQDYDLLTRFCVRRGFRFDALHSVNDGSLCVQSALTRIDEFFKSEERLLTLVALSHGNSKGGGWQMYDGTVDPFDVLHLWCQRNVFDAQKQLFILIDCCYSGHWVDVCARLGLPNVCVQSATSSMRKALDRVDETFTQHWIRQQEDPAYAIPWQPQKKPQAYLPSGVVPRMANGAQINFVGVPAILYAAPADPTRVQAVVAAEHRRRLQWGSFRAAVHGRAKKVAAFGVMLLSIATGMGRSRPGSDVGAEQGSPLLCHSGVQAAAPTGPPAGTYVSAASISLKMRSLESGDIVGVLPAGKTFEVARVVHGSKIPALKHFGNRWWGVDAQSHTAALTDKDGSTLNAFPIQQLLDTREFFAFSARGVEIYDAGGAEAGSLPVGASIECQEVVAGSAVEALAALGGRRWWARSASGAFYALTDSEGDTFHAMPHAWALTPGPHAVLDTDPAYRMDVYDEQGQKLGPLPKDEPFTVDRAVQGGSVRALSAFGQDRWWGVDFDKRFHALTTADGRTLLAIPTSRWPQRVTYRVDR